MTQPEPGVHVPRVWTRYVAIGDSFTEGMSDDDPAFARDGEFGGWADRLAANLSLLAHDQGLEFAYANLAVRGRKLADIVGPQLDDALDLEPDLVSIVGGGNDILRPRADLDGLAARLEAAVARIRASGADVLMATPVDPADAPLVRATRGRAAIHTANIWSIARRNGAHVIDQWGLHALRDWRMWSEDRIHMTAEGHRRVSLAALEALGHSPAETGWATPLDPGPAVGRRAALQANAQWARVHVGPWVHRRLTGRSSGDHRTAKRPALSPVD
jgi:lysophospholipase L1-like esterase